MASSAPATSCRTLHIAVNSLLAYGRPRERLLSSLSRAHVPMDQVHVFLGGDDGHGLRRSVVHQDDNGTRYYRVPYNSVDFTAMVHIVENPDSFMDVRLWFYMHDTCEVGGSFWSNLTRWCSGLPSCALPLTRWAPSSSMGLYDAHFLADSRADVLALKNARALPAEKWKKRGFGWEDKLFKVCDARSPSPVRRFTRKCWNATLQRHTCMCSTISVDPTPIQLYGAESAPRQAWRFPCADIVKYKANFQRNLTLVMRP